MERPKAARFTIPSREAGIWHVLHTKSRQEKILADSLEAMGIPCYLPLVRQPRYYGRHKLLVELPLFACYVFLRGTLDDAYRADRTNRVARIISVTDQDRLDWELRNIQFALDRGACLSEFRPLTRGTRVEIRSGPFRGLQGVVEDSAKPDRLVLQVLTLGRAVSLETDGALLERVE
jgi:transcription antitermination factor NusG